MKPDLLHVGHGLDNYQIVILSSGGQNSKLAQPGKLEVVTDLGLNPGNNMVLPLCHVPPIFGSVGSAKYINKIGGPNSFLCFFFLRIKFFSLLKVNISAWNLIFP